MTDYGNPQYRASTPEDKENMRAVMAEAHNAFTIDSMSINSGKMTRDSINIKINFDMTVFDGDRWDEDSTRYKMESVIFNSLFARFRAEGRYGQMSVTYTDSGECTRDTF
mgnify:FL=1